MKNSYWKYITYVILYKVCEVYAVASGANEPIADNELGLTAKDCALQYCTEKDGMSLWLSLVNQCVSNPNPYLRQKTNKEEIIEEIEIAKANLQTLSTTQQNKYFTHPIFGDLSVPKTLRFFTVHTNHHLKIIRAIQ